MVLKRSGTWLSEVVRNTRKGQLKLGGNHVGLIDVRYAINEIRCNIYFESVRIANYYSMKFSYKCAHSIMLMSN